MSESPRLVTLGTINAGATAIQADVTTLGSDVAVGVTLTTDYELANPRPPGFPFRPSMTGTDQFGLDYPKTVLSGTSIKVLACEADALINAGAATLT